MNSIIDNLWLGIQQTTLLEAIAVLFGLASVWYARKGNILVFPTGIVSVIIYVYICFGAKLYADMGINAYYFVMSVYGWYTWSQKSGRRTIPIEKNSTMENIVSLAIFALSFFILRWLLIHYTDSDVPNIDALTTAIFFVAMWLMARKKLENWTAWIIADAISIPLYFYKGLLLTSAQYVVFLVLAIMGYITWRNEISASKPQTV